MNDCERTDRFLDAFIDRDLAPDQGAKVESHLEHCVACRDHLTALEDLRAAATALGSSLEPRRDLWPEIEARLDRNARPWRRALLMAAAAAVALTAAAGLFWFGNQNPAQSSDPRRGATPVGVVTANREVVDIAEVRESYRTARAELLTVIDARRSSLAPETLEVIARNMALIDDAILQIEAALEDAPAESHLDRHLLMAYNQQIELLKWAARISA